MNLGNLKLRHLLLLVGICFVFAVVFLAFLPSFSGGEEFSELWVLGPNRTVEEYPEAIMVGESHTLHLVITSHVPSGGEYLVNVKLRNQTDPAPNSDRKEPSSLKPIHEYQMVLAEAEQKEVGIVFSFSNIAFGDEICKISRILFDGSSFSVDKELRWDEDNEGFYCQLFFELWIFDEDLSDYKFDGSNVGIWLKVEEES